MKAATRACFIVASVTLIAAFDPSAFDTCTLKRLPNACFEGQTFKTLSSAAVGGQEGCCRECVNDTKCTHYNKKWYRFADIWYRYNYLIICISWRWCYYLYCHSSYWFRCVF